MTEAERAVVEAAKAFAHAHGEITPELRALENAVRALEAAPQMVRCDFGVDCQSQFCVKRNAHIEGCSLECYEPIPVAPAPHTIPETDAEKNAREEKCLREEIARLEKTIDHMVKDCAREKVEAKRKGFVVGWIARDAPGDYTAEVNERGHAEAARRYPLPDAGEPRINLVAAHGSQITKTEMTAEEHVVCKAVDRCADLAMSKDWETMAVERERKAFAAGCKFEHLQNSSGPVYLDMGKCEAEAARHYPLPDAGTAHIDDAPEPEYTPDHRTQEVPRPDILFDEHGAWTANEEKSLRRIIARIQERTLAEVRKIILALRYGDRIVNMDHRLGDVEQAMIRAREDA